MFRKLISSLLVTLPLFGASVNAQDNPPPAGQFNALPSFACASTTGCVVKAAPGNLYSFLTYCSAACWVQVFNSATVPADGPTTAGTAAGNLVACHASAAAGVVEHDWLPYSLYFTSGIVIAFSSTTCTTLTKGAGVFIHATAK